MFSVDNFYTIFNSYYGWPKKNNILFLFRNHGSKNWCDIDGWGKPVIESWPKNLLWFADNGGFLMHDQEPFSLSEISNLRSKIQDVSYLEQLKKQYPDSVPYFNGLHDVAKYTDDICFSYYVVKSTKVPIICHSEKNSQDIKKLTHGNQANWIDCYYWWHGMIARDWFRHWEKHNDLQVTNKSDAQYRFLIYSRDSSGSRMYRKAVINHLRSHQAMVNYNWNYDFRCATLSATIDVPDANNSAIHLVAETLFDTEKIYLTEKVFKPMVMCQPFIIFAPPKSLEYLRSYGFRTFDKFWSEDYDLIVNSEDRRIAISRLIDSLASIETKEFNQLYQEMLPVIDYNRKYFYSQDFQNLLWNELQKNCSEALQKQQELSEQLPGGTYLYCINKIIESHSYVNETWRYTIPNLVEQCNIKEQVIKTYPKLKEFI